MEQQREALLGQIWAAQDEAYDLMYEYDSPSPTVTGLTFSISRRPISSTSSVSTRRLPSPSWPPF